ncbi:hypothetical protein ABIF79_003725 [Bradyrhizobium japonicum]
MMANLPADILVELEQAVATCPPDRCARILSGIVQLLSGSRDRPQELLAGVVDGVLLRLTERVEAKALVQLSTALAELKVAPPETLQRLASHDGRVEDWRADRPLDRATFPVPSTSHAACGFPALRAPICFTPTLMGPILLGRLSARRVALCRR